VIIVAPVAWLITVLAGRVPDAANIVARSALLTRLAQLDFRGVPIGTDLAKIGGTIASAVPSELMRFVGSATAALVNLTVMLFGLFYMLGADANTWATVRSYVPFSARTADALRERFVGVTQATVLGTGAACVAQGIFIGTSFALTGLPDPLLWGTVSVFAAVIPGIGSTLVWLPGVLALAVTHRYGAAGIVLLFGFGLAGNCERIIRPLVNRHVSQIHPMITLVGAFAGIRYYGIVGLLLGPLAIVYVFELLRFYREEYTTPS
jgi:predicted PurR-regulated permease PerM